MVDFVKKTDNKTAEDDSQVNQQPDDGVNDKNKPTNGFRIGYLIHDVSRMRRTLFDQHLKPLSITRSQWWVLANISRRPNKGIISSVLARDLDVGKVILSGLVDKLEMAGYIYRRRHKTARRAMLIFITDAGYGLIEEMKGVIKPLNIKSCDGLTPEQITMVEFGLNAIKTNLREMLGEDKNSEV